LAQFVKRGGEGERAWAVGLRGGQSVEGFDDGENARGGPVGERGRLSPSSVGAAPTAREPRKL